MEFKIDKKLVIIAILIAMPVAYGQFDFPSSFGFRGYGFGGPLDFQGIYTSYPGFIDFLVFFMIFGGISRLVFSKIFQDRPGTNALYLGLGLALSIGGVYYDYLSLATLGPFAVILLGVAFFQLLRITDMPKWIAWILSIIALLVGLQLFNGIGYGGYGANFISYVPSFLFSSWIPGLGLLVLLFWIVMMIIRKFKPEDRMPRDDGRGGRGGGGGGGGRSPISEDDIRGIREQVASDIERLTSGIRNDISEMGDKMTGIRGSVQTLTDNFQRLNDELGTANSYGERIRKLESDLKDAKDENKSKEILDQITTLNQTLNTFFSNLGRNLGSLHHDLEFHIKNSSDMISRLALLDGEVRRIKRKTEEEERAGLTHLASNEPVRLEESLVLLSKEQKNAFDIWRRISHDIMKMRNELSSRNPNVNRIERLNKDVISSLVLQLRHIDDFGRISGRIKEVAQLLQGAQRKLLTENAGVRPTNESWTKQDLEDFRTLQVKVGASWPEIKSEFVKQVKILHPDSRSKEPDWKKNQHMEIFRETIDAHKRLEDSYRKRGRI